MPFSTYLVLICTHSEMTFHDFSVVFSENEERFISATFWQQVMEIFFVSFLIGLGRPPTCPRQSLRHYWFKVVFISWTLLSLLFTILGSSFLLGRKRYRTCLTQSDWIWRLTLYSEVWIPNIPKVRNATSISWHWECFHYSSQTSGCIRAPFLASVIP